MVGCAGGCAEVTVSLMPITVGAFEVMMPLTVQHSPCPLGLLLSGDVHGLQVRCVMPLEPCGCPPPPPSPARGAVQGTLLGSLLAQGPSKGHTTCTMHMSVHINFFLCAYSRLLHLLHAYAAGISHL